MDIGAGGRFASSFSGGFSSVPEALRRYDEIERELASWPECPKSEVRKSSESWYRYCATRLKYDDVDGPTVWPEGKQPDGRDWECGAGASPLR
jgi:hypothetical protein